MKIKTPHVLSELETFVAGDWVAPGLYQQMEGRCTVRMDQAGYLPASLDGRVAYYRRARPTWGQITAAPPGGMRPSLAFGTEVGQ